MDDRNRNDDELNNQGDYISGDVGEDGKDIVVGKNIDTRRNQQRNDINVNVLPKNHPANKATIGDIYVTLTGDPLTEAPGLIKRVSDIDRRLRVVEHELVDIKELIIIRNENRGKIHISLWQLFVLVLLIVFLIVVLAPWLQHVFAGGKLDGRIGSAIPLLFHN